MPSPMIQDAKPLRSLNGSVALTSGVAPGTLMHRLTLTIVTSASTISIAMADGSTASLGSLPVGFYQLDVEFLSVTAGTPANVTAVGFYAIEG